MSGPRRFTIDVSGVELIQLGTGLGALAVELVDLARRADDLAAAADLEGQAARALALRDRLDGVWINRDRQAG